MKNDGIAAVERSTSLRSDSHGTMETGSGKCQEPRSAKPDQRAQPLHRGITAFIIVGTILVGPASYAICNAMPGIQVLRSDAMTAVAVAIFAATYLVIAIGKLPGFHLDRAGAALLGASLMVGSGVLSLDHAYRAIDFDTIALLLGMMIVVANLRLSGFFRLVNNWVVTRAHHPFMLLAAIVFVAGSLSAFLVNDTICLVMTPLVFQIVVRLTRNPAPYLLATAMASNIGSTATITGNPQNMIIGSLSHIPYGAFAASLWPVAAVGLVLLTALIALIYRGNSGSSSHASCDQVRSRHGRHDGSVLRRPARRQGGDRWGRLAALHAQVKGRKGLPRDRLAAARHVRRPVHRCSRRRERRTHARSYCGRRTASS